MDPADPDPDPKPCPAGKFESLYLADIWEARFKPLGARLSPFLPTQRTEHKKVGNN